MKEQLNTLKLAAWTLITIGTIETIFLIHAVMSRTSFSGGAFLYIIAGIFLFKKNRTAYKFLLVTFTALFALIPGGVILLGWMAAQIYTATDLPLVWSGPGAAALIFVVYLGLVLALVGLLYHPNTRSAMGLEPYQGTVRTLYMSKPRFIILLALSIVLAGLLGGPHILHNPYKVAVEGLKANANVRAQVGDMRRLELLDAEENNWYAFSSWKVTGTKGQGTYKTELSPSSVLTIDGSQAAADCTPGTTSTKNTTKEHGAC